MHADSEKQFHTEQSIINKSMNQKNDLNQFDIVKNGLFMGKIGQMQTLLNFMLLLTQYVITQCRRCQDAWPLKSKPRSPNVCSRWSTDKKSPKTFSCENSMVPSLVLHELQNLTQIEEMLIACALPIMRVYFKPGGQ